MAVRDKTAGESEAIRDKIAEGGEAARDKTAEEGEAIHDKIAGGETADDNTIDPSVELAILEAAELAVDPFVGLVVLEAADRVDEEADKNIVEEIVSNSSTEAIIDKFAGERVEEFTVNPSIEAILVAEERVDEFSVDPSIEAIQAAERIDKEAEGPRFESKLQ